MVHDDLCLDIQLLKLFRLLVLTDDPTKVYSFSKTFSGLSSSWLLSSRRPKARHAHDEEMPKNTSQQKLKTFGNQGNLHVGRINSLLWNCWENMKETIGDPYHWCFQPGFPMDFSMALTEPKASTWNPKLGLWNPPVLGSPVPVVAVSACQQFTEI